LAYGLPYAVLYPPVHGTQRRRFSALGKHRDEVESDEHREKLDAVPYTKAELLEYWEIVNGRIDSQVDLVNLTSPDCGIPWYKMPKLDHIIMNLRHIQEHSGQLRDRLLEAGIDVKWVGKS
jgi:hypothetical protein